MSGAGNMDIGEEIRLSVASIPFVRALGVEYVAVGRECCHLRVPVEPRFAAVPGEVGLAPGFIAGVLDQLGSCALTGFFGSRHAQATLSMSLSFARDLRAGAALDLIGKAKFETGTTGSVAMTAEGDNGAVLAQGLVAFMIGTYPGSSGDNAAHDHEGQGDREAFAPETVEAECLDAWMGMQFEDRKTVLPLANRLIGSTGPVVAFHGGAVAAAAIADAVQSAAALDAFHLSHFSLEYLRAAKAETIMLRSHIVRRSRRTLVLRTDVFQEDGARHVAATTSRFVGAD